ncbi:hypothetical protein GCM10027280_22470 [Micromonospora polyrhachis]|uniref:Uncharacterized protein n=1 Tax=Micromonospora polyrhachis TaxID=1282883 RepID=A0A7W7SVV2_9ACTN|nr:hypothetical protein [Micromonospora polyrhachis]MBB4961541.1 hypothetical protein [Micromonospora polyrhachis]
MSEIRKVESTRYVAHLPFTARDLSSALIFTRTLVRSLAFLDELDGGEATLTYEGEQNQHHRIFCDLLVANGRRCERRAGHDGSCQPRGGLRA